jgi:5-methylcytosine-specific restriction endonuclease McrA
MKKRLWIDPDVRRRVEDAYINCYYCGASPDKRSRYDWPPPLRLELDHLVALDAGGTDEESNLVMACSKCNRSKGAKSVPAFAHWLQSVVWPRYVRGWREAHGG